MASLKLEHIYKVYPNGTKAVNDFSLDIENGEFIVFVGPSGCGKSTTLRMIAGLEEITAGELYIDSAIVNDMEPKDRDIAMVFQNYALYPHMTVYENMAFGLRLRHVPEDVIQEKVLWASDILGIKEYLDRKPRNMSGGQRQRVSLGRAILRDPKVMLLDEPLSNLDAKLRAQMRTEIAKLHQRLKTTFIYVTHDQTEAMTLGDRVVVMKGGRIQQVDTPKNLYNYPGNKFVAGFIGTPQMNFYGCTLKKEKNNVLLSFNGCENKLSIDFNLLLKVLPEYLDGNHKLTFGVRCEHVYLANNADKDAIPVKISHFEELGSECLIYGTIFDDKEIIIKVREIEGLSVDQEIKVKFDFDHVYFFDGENENTIVPRIPEYNSFDASIEKGNLVVMKQKIELPEALRCGEVKNGELQIPVDAIHIAEDGTPAKVVCCEKIGDKILAHLQTEGRIYFALVNEEIEEGKSVKVKLDFTRLTFSFEGVNMFKPIDQFDSLYASFYNFDTVMNEKPDAEFSAYRDEKIKAAETYFDAKIELENEEYKKKAEELNNVDVQGEYAKKAAEYNEFRKNSLQKSKDIKKENNAKISELNRDFKAKKKEATEKNNALFAEKKAKEENEYRQFMENNKDKAMQKRRTDEYHMFKDNFQSDKENTLNRIINRLLQEHESDVSSLKANSRRQLDTIKKELKDRKKELAISKDPAGYLEKEHSNKLKELELKKSEEAKRAGFVFFFKFDGNYYGFASDIISNKLIQGLGTRVFSRRFRIDVPHDGYVISEKNNAFKVVAEASLDYGDTYFVRSHYIDDNGQTKYLFLKSDKPIEVGKELNIEFDVSRAQITETDMNIRLY